MTMVCGLDLHRRQITFDAVEVESGQVWTGRVWQPDRQRFRRWLRDDVTERAGGGPVAIAVEGCTGWRYVVEEVVAAGFEAHLAEPADTQAARGRKRRAKTDRSDCRLLRELLADGRLPASWIAPTIVLEWRERARLYKTLVDQRSTWVQRIHAELYQHGVTLPETSIRWAKTRELLEDDGLEISPAGRQRVLTAYRMIDAITIESRPLKADLQRFGRRQPGCRALVEQPVRDRRAVGGGVVVRARRLPTLRPFRTGGAPQRSRRDRRPVGSATRRRVHLPSRTPDVALGALRGSEERVASTQPRPRLLRRRQGPSQRQAGHHLDGPQTRPTLLPRPASRRPRRRLRDALTTAVEVDARHRPPAHHGSSRGQLPQPACPPASVLDGLQTLTRPRTHHRGGHPIRDVVADDEFVEHPGNAGRLRTIKPRPIASMHRPSGWSRSYVLASLRALHLDQHLRPGALRTKRALTPAARTGNAGFTT